jgi:hypothetical protein
MTLGEDAGSRRGADDARGNAAVTGRAIAAAADEAAIGLDLDLQNGGILGAADGGEGSATTVAMAVCGGDLAFFDEGGEVAVIASLRTWLAPLLAAWPSGWSVGGGRGRCRGGSGRGLGLFAEELLLAETQLGAELFVLLA